MYAREFRDGAKDGLEALEPLDPDRITSFSDLLEAMGKTAFGGRHLGKAFDVLWADLVLIEASALGSAGDEAPESAEGDEA